MATIPTCGICGGKGWGHICAGTIPPSILTPSVERAAKRVEAVGDARMKALDRAALVTLKASGFAPLGQCAHCDAMRAGAAERQRRITEKRKTKGKNR
jgi:hypothetical protein